MNIDDIKRHSNYKQLSPQQQVFVIARCEGKEKIEAAKEAWNCKSDESAEASANRALRNPRIEWLLGKFYGDAPVPTREELVSDLYRRAKGMGDREYVAAFQLITEIMGWKFKPAEAPAQATSEASMDEDFEI